MHPIIAIYKLYANVYLRSIYRTLFIRSSLILAVDIYTIL
jgi:hypothetical protein